YDEVAGNTVQYLFGDMFKDYVELKAETLSSSCFINDGKGNYKKEALPGELQLAPIFSFTSFPGGNGAPYISGGNFYGGLPYEGRYDAMSPTIFDYDKKSGKFITLSELPSLPGEFRDAKWI